MAVKWTKDQERAIHASGNDILVAAAAGSGKTAVLVERILEKVCRADDPVDLDQLLVVTFTRAAAAQMKDRLEQALLRKIGETPADRRLRRQLVLLHYAQITTIDSFCLRIVENCSEQLDLDPAFRIGDEGELKLLFEDVLQEMLEEKHAEKDPAFLHLLRCYAAGRKDSRIEELLSDLYKYSESYPWPDEWLENCSRMYDAEDPEDLASLPPVAFLYSEIRREITELRDLSLTALKMARKSDDPAAMGPHMYEPAILDDLSAIEGVLAAEDLWGVIRQLSAYEPARLSGKKDPTVDPELREAVKALRTGIKDRLKELHEQTAQMDPDRLVREIRALRAPMQTLVRLTRELSERFTAAKKEKKIVSFNDIEHLALSVLIRRTVEGTERTDTAREMAEAFREIMIDEYQDESRLQEEILTAVSGRGRGEKNLFMVGDVKQSIYKFRQARPELFLEKYERFLDEGPEGIRIDLHQNFRSRPEVRRAVNDLFSKIMTRPLGGILYDDRAALHAGRTETEDEEHRTVLLLTETGDPKKEPDSVPEAGMIAAEIRRLKESGFTVPEGGEERPLRYGDIAILVRGGGRRCEEIAEVLLKAGIPAAAQSRAGYFHAWEVEQALSWLRVIDNPLRDIPLAAVMKSRRGGFSSEDLARVQILARDARGEEIPPADEDFFYDRIGLCAAGEGEEAEKCRDFLELLNRFRDAAARLSVHELLQMIYDETGFYDEVTLLPGGAVRRANLDLLMEKAIAFEATSYHGIFQFLRYVDKLVRYEMDYAEGRGSEAGTDRVSVTTIHASKGLEYPVVFVACLDRMFNMTDERKGVLANAEWGIAADPVDAEKRLRIRGHLKRCFARQLRREMLGEELRVLYVAMTRAREKLYLTASVKDLTAAEEKWSGLSLLEDGEVPLISLGKATCFLHWILMARAAGCPLTVRLSGKAETEAEEEKEKSRVRSAREVLAPVRETVSREETEKLGKTLSFRYPHENEEQIPVKVSVSELKHLWMDRVTQEEEDAPGSHALLPEKGQPSEGALLGTAYHKIFECWDYNAPDDPESVAVQVRAIAERTKIPLGEKVDPGRILTFLHGTLGILMKTAAREGRLKRETQFMIGVPASMIREGAPEETRVLVQGVIDAWIEEEDGITIIDYKTDRLPAEDPMGTLELRYREQMRYYAAALSQITGKKVKECLLYSVPLSSSVRADLAGSEGTITE